MKSDIPILGICGGMQLMGAVVGLRLYQQTPADVPNCLEHMRRELPGQPAHEVEIEKGALLAKLWDSSRIAVNSVRHQAISEPGPKAIVSAKAPDGIVEAIELPDKRFAMRA